MMKLLMNIQKIVIRSEVFGDLWDMFWNHHWFSKKYLGPLTIMTHRTVIFD
jgi:hypothetical protein